MDLPVIEVYTSIECPYAHLMNFRIRQIWPEYSGQLQIVWRSLSLEYVNKAPASKPNFDAEFDLFERIEPSLPYRSWSHPEWQWPSTIWPAFEALACAQAQSPEAAFEMSWALRYALFEENRCIAIRQTIREIAQNLAQTTNLDFNRFMADWDRGRYKETVITESRRGWEELKLSGSATLLLPNGERITNPAIGEINFDEKEHVLHSYTKYDGNPIEDYRQIFDKAIALTG